MKNQPLSAPAVTGQPVRHVMADKLLQSIPEMLFALDAEGHFHYASAGSHSLLGYAPQSLQGKAFSSVVHPDYTEAISVAIHGSFHVFEKESFALLCLHHSGREVPVVLSGNWNEAEGLFYGTARSGLESLALQARLVKAQEMARIAHFEFDCIEGHFLHASATFFDILGLPTRCPRAISLADYRALVHPDELNSNDDGALALLHAKGEHSYRMIRPDGYTRHIICNGELVCDEEGRLLRIIGTIQDVSRQKEIECALRRSEERLRFLVQNGTDLLGIIDANGNYIFVGENVEPLLGYRQEELVGQNAFQFIHPDEHAWLGGELAKMADQKAASVGPYRFRDAGGNWRWIETTVTNHLDHPAIAGLVVNSRDVTERKLKEDALRVSDDKMKSLIRNGSDLIVIIDGEANFTFVSDNVVEILGYTPDEVIGRSAFEFIHRKDFEKVSAEIALILFNDERAKGVEHRFLHKNGKWVWLESKGSNYMNDTTLNGILVNSRNIDDRVRLQKRLKSELINKQKEITAAVIKAQETERSQLGLELHDNVNQILTTVKLYSELYLSGYMQDRELLVKAIQYTQDCINEIRSISKRLSAPTLGKISLHDSIRELIDSINLTRRIEIRFKTAELEAVPVHEDLHLAIYRIVQEGLNNVIKYSSARNAEVEISYQPKELWLKIWDDGVGFDTNLKRSGIGLTNMRTRAESLNAIFDLVSAEGSGCTIQICFPVGGSLA